VLKAFPFRLIGCLGVLLLFRGQGAPLFAAGEQVYLEPETFLAQSFTIEPEKKVLWLTPPLKARIREILGHDYPGLRLRYWAAGNRTAWILEEIGKTRPITAGFVVEDGRLVDMKVLIYRESHGWEVRYPFFTDQFSGATLEEGSTRLDRSIDGISGATLSVNALTRLARLALALHQEVTP